MSKMKSLLWVAALFLAALSAVSTRAASVDGLNIQYSVAGNGQTIIFVHGWTCDDRSWSNQVSEFSKHYRVVTLELPGHGKSDAPAPEDFSMKLFAAAVEAVRAEISGADRVVLVGHSMGAVVIRQYALDYPERVAGLVAVDGELDVRPFANLKVPPMTQQRRVSAIEGMFVNETSEALRQKIRDMMLGATEATAVGANATILDPMIQSDQKIYAPALTVWAGNRASGTGLTSKEMLPNWEGVQIPGTGHFVMMEKPREFNALLQDFLRRRANY